MITTLALAVATAFAQEPAPSAPTEWPGAVAASLGQSLVFLSTFDGTVDAQLAAGDARLHTREEQGSKTLDRPSLTDKAVEPAVGKGRFGDALRFLTKKRKMTFYQGADNMGFDEKSWSGAISFWLQLDPAKDLEPGFCDPIQITDTKYNDASIWVDFTKENPRSFRLGVIGDLKAWNPENLAPDANGAFAERLIVVEPQPFARERWTHVLINFEGLNSESGKTELFIDGRSMGALAVKDPFTWDEARARIMLGINYIGLMDELAIFDRPLSGDEVVAVHRGPSLQGLLAGSEK